MVKYEGEIFSTEANLPPQTLRFIDMLLKIQNLDILNPLSTLSCQNVGVVLDMESLLRFFPYQNFPPSKWVGSMLYRSLMNLILPQKSLSLFAHPHLSIDSNEDFCDCQVWALDLVAFQFFIKSPHWKSILFWVWATDNVKQLNHNLMHTLGIMMLLQIMIFRGKSMQEDVMLEDYNILLSSTIILNLRSWGGSPRPTNSKETQGVSRSSMPKGT